MEDVFRGADEDGMLRMSFLDHLEELRSRIIRALCGFGAPGAIADPACSDFRHCRRRTGTLPRDRSHRQSARGGGWLRNSTPRLPGSGLPAPVSRDEEHRSRRARRRRDGRLQNSWRKSRTRRSRAGLYRRHDSRLRVWARSRRIHLPCRRRRPEGREVCRNRPNRALPAGRYRRRIRIGWCEATDLSRWWAAGREERQGKQNE
jgi:hypothetical protein